MLDFKITFGSSSGCRSDDVLHPTRSKSVKFLLQTESISGIDYLRSAKVVKSTWSPCSFTVKAVNTFIQLLTQMIRSQ